MRALKGIAEPVQVWRVTGLQEEQDEEFETTAADFPLVGRDEEIGLLRRAWQQTKEDGHGQVVFISGEPGIGKSALIDTLRRSARSEGLTRITFRCSPYHTNSALYPVVEHWKRLAGWMPEDDGGDRQLSSKAFWRPTGCRQTRPCLCSHPFCRCHSKIVIRSST
jgi:hypothetical protein